jgi:predicted outer membrane repeat protein
MSSSRFHPKAIVALLAVSTCAMLTHAASALVIVVPAHQPTIQAAINAAQNGDYVLLQAGTYTGPGNYNINFAGKAITVQGIEGPSQTIIDIQATPQNQRTGFIFHANESSASVLQGVTIKRGYQFNGAAIHISGSASPTIRNCVFTENHADCWGGALYYENGAGPTIAACCFFNNYSADDGGAIFGITGSPTIIDCQITNNVSAFTGGAITTFGGGSPKLSNSTLVGNSAYWGAAIYSSNLQIVNSIIWGNTGGSQQIYTGGQALSVRYSIVQGGYAGTGNLDVAPQFVNAAGGDFHLLRGSPGIDAGDPFTSLTPGSVDMDGDPRIFGVRIDMGMDEFRKPGDVNGDHHVNINDLFAVISAWGPCTDNPADLNRDFTVNVDDLFIVIMNWG